MALIFSPLTEDALEGPYEPIPKGVFLMLQLGEGVSRLEIDMRDAAEGVLRQRKFERILATSERGHKDYLAKIIQLIRGCGMGTAIFSEYTPAPTLANIFFEVALCNLLGKPVIIVKSESAKVPSDFVRTEWVTYNSPQPSRFRNDYSASLSAMLKLAKHYETLGDLAMEAEEVDFELAFERYRQSFLIDGSNTVQRKISSLRERARRDSDPAANLLPARKRFRAAISEFAKFIER